MTVLTVVDPDDTPPSTAPPAPDDLTGDALALWETTHREAAEDDLDLDARETALLLAACRAGANVERLRQAVDGLDDLVVKGSTGQLVAHPLIAALDRAQGVALAHLRALAVPAAQSAAQAAKADARWSAP